MKKRILLMIFVFLFVFASNTFAAEETSVRDSLIQLLQNLVSGMGKAAVSDTVSSQSSLSIFKMTELVSNNLNENNNASIEFWTQANCSGSYVYVVPTGYKLISCTGGSAGTHGGCSTCGMAKIVLMKTTTSSTVAPINGACGSANGTTTSSKPTTNLCSKGNADFKGDTDNWAWTCVGSNGGTSASCYANKTSQVEAPICGSSNGQSLSNAPTNTSTNLCKVGTASAVTANNTGWTWSCSNSNETTTSVVQCSATKISGISSDLSIFRMTELVSNNLNETNNPSIEFWTQANCSGSYVYVVPTGYRLVSCTGGSAGIHGGCSTCGMAKIVLMKTTTSSTTTTSTPVNGACGSANGTTTSSMPTANLCSKGNSDIGYSPNTWIWTCVGSNGGTTASCYANKKNQVSKINGVCGSPNKTTVSSAPASNLCEPGSPSAVILGGSGNNAFYYWTCVGSNGGTTASCYASYKQSTANKVDGACGSAKRTTISAAPTSNLCETGSPSTVGGNNTFYYWNCLGSNGGTTASCYAYKK